MAEPLARRIARWLIGTIVLWVGMYYSFAAVISEQGRTWAMVLMFVYFPVVLLGGFVLAWLMPRLIPRMAVVLAAGLVAVTIGAATSGDLVQFHLVALLWAVIFQIILWGQLPRAVDEPDHTQGG